MFAKRQCPHLLHAARTRWIATLICLAMIIGVAAIVYCCLCATPLDYSEFTISELIEALQNEKIEGIDHPNAKWVLPFSELDPVEPVILPEDLPPEARDDARRRSEERRVGKECRL